jgi:hypothetical protein
VTRSGWCGLHVPEGHVSHARCTFTTCPCSCHRALAAETSATEPGGREPGFYPDVPEAEYHADRLSLSVSGAKLLLKAPAIFRHRLEHPEHKDVFDFGSAAHALVLGVGAELVVHQYDVDKVKSPKSTNAWKAQQAEVREAGAVLLLPDEHAAVTAMADALSSHTLAMRLLSEGQPEVSAYAPDEATGVMRRGRFDWLGAAVLTDYKTCVSANPRDWSGRYGVISKLRYDAQAAWYLDLARDLGHPAAAFAFVAQEKEPPYLVSVVYVDDADLWQARDDNAAALALFRDCTAAGRWPGYLPDDAAALVSLTDQTYRIENVA